MAQKTFTTWADLLTELLNRLANRDFSTASVTVAGNAITWTSTDELLRVIEYVRSQAALESGAASLRVYARNGGRG